EDGLTIILLGQHHAIADVRGPVIARGFEAELVTFFSEREIDEALGIPAGDVGGLFAGLGVVAGARGLLHFVAHAVALVDFDQRFDLRIVVAPVGAHAGGAGVAGTDAVEFLQVAVEHLGVIGVDSADALLLIGLGEAGQGAHSALGEHAVAMAVRIADAAFV